MNDENTIPVIFIGVEPIQAKGFKRVIVRRGDSELLFHEGSFDIHMEGESLLVQFSPRSVEDMSKHPSEQ